MPPNQMLMVVVATELPPAPCHPTVFNQFDERVQERYILTERNGKGNNANREA